jgi:prephenate dehydrogenase
MIPQITIASRVLIVGFGRFGQHVKQLLDDKLPGLHVRVYDNNHNVVPEEFFAPFDSVGEYDIVILCVPIAAYESVLQDLVPRLRKDAILVDVASVKVHTSRLMKKYADHCFRISTHPMWGPQSYEKTKGDLKDYRLVVTESTLPQSLYKALCTWFESTGGKVIKMTPAHHDGHLSKTLFLTHFIGQIIHIAGFDRTEIDTVSFGYLMDAVDSVRDDAMLFLDVYRHNKVACSAVLERVENATHTVRGMIEGSNV